MLIWKERRHSFLNLVKILLKKVSSTINIIFVLKFEFISCFLLLALFREISSSFIESIVLIFVFQIFTLR